MSSFSKFTELSLHEDLQRALEKMNFVEPTPIQQQTLVEALKGRDVLGCAQTGTGKTGAFGIPLIQYLLNHPEKKALILAPTRELADQINRTLQEMAFFSYKIKIALIIGGASQGQQVRALEQGARIVVATPGRLIDLLNQNKVSLGNVGVLVLDEVDRMLDMGFAPQLKQIVPHLPKERQAMLFSATMPSEILSIAESYLRTPLRVTVGEKNVAADTIEQKMIQTQQDSKQHTLLKELPLVTGKTIIFVRTQHGTERLSKAVRAAGYRTERLHGGRSQVQRRRALDNFRKGEVQFLIATDIAGRGIDIDDIELVINYDMPKTHEDYIHRIGRTGRFGRKGVALNFVTFEDLALMRILDPANFPSRREPSRGQARPNARGAQAPQQSRGPRPSAPQGRGARPSSPPQSRGGRPASPQANRDAKPVRAPSQAPRPNDRNPVKPHAVDTGKPQERAPRKPQPTQAARSGRPADRNFGKPQAAKPQVRESGKFQNERGSKPKPSKPRVEERKDLTHAKVSRVKS